MPILTVPREDRVYRAAKDGRERPKVYTKDPEAILDYTIDLSAWLDGDAIKASEWIVGDELEVLRDREQTTIRSSTIWLGGGRDGDNQVVTFRWETTQGRRDKRSFVIAVRER